MRQTAIVTVMVAMFAVAARANATPTIKRADYCGSGEAGPFLVLAEKQIHHVSSIATVNLCCKPTACSWKTIHGDTVTAKVSAPTTKRASWLITAEGVTCTVTPRLPDRPLTKCYRSG